MAEKNQALDAALRKWQGEFNADVLEPKGIFCMSQSNCSIRTETQESETSTTYPCFRWIAFAFGANAVQALKDEPHLFGHIWKGDYEDNYLNVLKWLFTHIDNPNREHLVQCVVYSLSLSCVGCRKYILHASIEGGWVQRGG